MLRPSRSIPTAMMLCLVGIMAVLTGGAPATPTAALAQQEQRCFAETGHCISGRIRTFWEQNGGIAALGLPIAPQQAVMRDGNVVQMQWFERSRIELHPHQAAPYDVLLGHLGVETLQAQERDWQQFATTEPQPGCRYFAETGHNVCGAILARWQASGIELDGRPGTSAAESLARSGLPISAVMTEQLTDGREYQVQWFERTRIEYHPQNPPPYDVQVGLLGNELGAAVAAAPAAPATPAGTTAAAVGTLQAPTSIPAMLAPDTAIYASMQPIISGSPNAGRIQAAYPGLFVDSDPTTLNTMLMNDMGVTFQDNIQPWLGDEVALVVSGVGSMNSLGTPRTTRSLKPRALLGMLGMPETPGAIAPLNHLNPLHIGRLAAQVSGGDSAALIVAVQDPAGAQAFLDTQRSYRTEQRGHEFTETTYQGVTIVEEAFSGAFALVNGYVIFASDSGFITAMIDRQMSGGESLATNPAFTTVQANLPDSRVGSIYMAGNLYASLLQEQVGTTSSVQTLGSLALGNGVLPGGQIQDDLLQAVRALGMSLSFVEQGMQFDLITALDVTRLDDGLRSEIAAARQPLDPSRYERIRSDALAFVTFTVPPTFKQQVLDMIAAQPDGQQSRQELEQQLNIDLERDVLNWMVGPATMVLMPFWDLPDNTLPFYAAIEPQDRASAQAGMNAIADGLEGMEEGGVAFLPETIGEVEWQVNRSTEPVFGYAFVGNELALAVGNRGMEAASTGPIAPITADGDFAALMNALPQPNTGMFYFDMEAMTGALTQYGGSPDVETMSIIAPMKAIGMAGVPGISASGIAHDRVVVVVR